MKASAEIWLRKEAGDWERWIPYYDRIDQIVVPNTKKLLDK